MKDSEQNHTAWGVRWTGLPMVWGPGRDHLIEDNLGRCCPKTFETKKGKERKVMPSGVEPRTSGSSRQHSATELYTTPTDNHPSFLCLLVLCSWVIIDELSGWDSPGCDSTHYHSWSVMRMLVKCLFPVGTKGQLVIGVDSLLLVIMQWMAETVERF